MQHHSFEFQIKQLIYRRVNLYQDQTFLVSPAYGTVSRPLSDDALNNQMTDD